MPSATKAFAQYFSSIHTILAILIKRPFSWNAAHVGLGIARAGHIDPSKVVLLLIAVIRILC
jgi:hypothetical protein